MNFPVGGRPYVDKIYKATPFLTDMYYANLNTDEYSYLSKRNLERLYIHFPVGPRYKMFAYEMPMNFMVRQDEPDGPDIVDVTTERYLREFDLKQCAMANTVANADPPKLR